MHVLNTDAMLTTTLLCYIRPLRISIKAGGKEGRKDIAKVGIPASELLLYDSGEK